MRDSRSTLVAALGFFAVVAQTLLFRDFLTAASGTELAVGVFFATWLAWVGVGAALGRFVARYASMSLRLLPYLALAYIPTFLGQHEVVLRAPDICGVAAYEVFPLGALVLFALCANAPFSILTGILFVVAASQRGEDTRLAPARVYALEAAGSAAGGLYVTVMLGVTASWFATTAGAALLLLAGSSMAIAPPRDGRSRAARTFGAFLAVCIVVFGAWEIAGHYLTDATVRISWSRMLPAEHYDGSFATPQALYSHGTLEGQTVVTAWGATAEVLPDEQSSAEKVALVLSQHPDAKSVLVVGPGTLSTCSSLLRLPSLERVTWLPPDPDYPEALHGALSQLDVDTDSRFLAPGFDVRTHLARHPGDYDVAILDLPDATSLLANRYLTHEFFGLLKYSLTADGVVAVRISGDENFIGGELSLLGASALVTLESVFAGIVMKPGGDTWLIASDREGISESPAVLRDRWASIPTAPSVYPPVALLSLYLPDRIALQRTAYDEIRVQRSDALLLNSDDSPRSLLWGLLLAVRKSGGREVTAHLTAASSAMPWIASIALALYVILRLAYRRRSDRSTVTAVTAFDAKALAASMGAASMATSILLMYLYQSRFGSLYLYVGVLTSLFMLGSYSGSALLSRRLGSSDSSSRLLFLGASTTQGLVLLTAWLASATLPWPAFLLLFFVAGAVGGAYFALADDALERGGADTTASASSLGLFDHLGAALGALLSGVLLLPVLGVGLTIAIGALLILANTILWCAPATAHSGTVTRPSQRRLAYAAFGIAAFLVLSRHVVLAYGDDAQAARLEHAAHELTGDSHLTLREFTGPDGATGPYVILGSDASRPAGYVFSSLALGTSTYGYGGIVDLAVYVDADGALRGLRLLGSRETPTYVELLHEWRAALNGRNVFTADGLAGVDTVSGATITSAAIRTSLGASGVAFAETVLGRPSGATVRAPAHSGSGSGLSLLLLLVFTGLAVTLHYRPGVWRRRAFLLASLVLGGLWLNMQFSVLHVLLLADPASAPLRFDGSTFLLFGVPTVVALFGNVYCGWMCPFGAAQELVGDLRPRALGELDKRMWRYLSLLKYGVLFCLVFAFAFAGPVGLADGDPLVGAFAFASPKMLMAVVAIILVGFIYKRFWCRALCPAGAFLSLLNGLRALRRFLPAPRPGFCDLGVARPDDIDCIRCDRCRTGPQEAPPPLAHPRLRTAAVIAAVVGLLQIYLATGDRRPSAAPATITSQQVHTEPRRELRNVDLIRIRELMRAGQLSEREAEYYHVLEPGAHAPSNDAAPQSAPQQ